MKAIIIPSRRGVFPFDLDTLAITGINRKLRDRAMLLDNSTPIIAKWYLYRLNYKH